MSEKKDMTAQVAIRKNMEKKKEWGAKGGLILDTGFSAQQLASRDIKKFMVGYLR